jgi:alpha,alpha-trehalose-phosphate synthase [UDP-forming]/trehalose-phosphatase
VPAYDHWLAFARSTPLALLLDLDGTLIPFAATPDEARPDAELLGLLHDLASAPGVTAAIASGRPREKLEALFGSCQGLLLVAEHSGWRRGAGAWEPFIAAEQGEVESLAEELERLAQRFQGAFVEHKTWSVAFHFRAIVPEARDAAAVEIEHRVHAWLRRHTGFAEFRGVQVIEVRPARMDKSHSIPWLRERAGAHARLLVLGDDITDEDTFRSLAAEDESVIVGSEHDRPTAARWRLDAPADARHFLAWLLAVRREVQDSMPALYPRAMEPRRARGDRDDGRYRLLVVSNRLPELRSAASSFEVKIRNVGGLVSALEPALRARQGVWLGWSGRTMPHADASRFGLDDSSHPNLAWVDFPKHWQDQYYTGLCNSALWPLLHSFPSRVRLSEEDWQAYQQANQGFARTAVELVGSSATVWIHDYHLLLLGQRLREQGHVGPIGLFLHVPFPGPDIFYILPWAEEILIALLGLDLIGFHTAAYVANFRQCASLVAGARVGDDAIEYRNRRTRIGAFPIGIIPEQFQQQAPPTSTEEVENLARAIAPTRLVLGVDRLDYTKGIPERLTAFARLLELFPEWRRKVSLVQISVPSRSDVPDYAEQRERVEQIVGRTNGDFGEADWVPIRYLYRSFGRQQLSFLYRCASVGYVTPLRDGMNLVAKEYVAAQDPDDPGVLVLSRFAGAACELGDALLTNPWYIDGLAHDLDRALRMGLAERQGRHQKLLASVARTTAISWAEDFLGTLSRCGGRPGG